jgi:polynucleotide 5'-hydroxyl-kinase GRC3/NOL9
MTNQPLDIPPAWDKIDLREARGTLMVIGATDTGKSTFAQYLYRRLCADPGRRVAYLDGDPGQSRLGPPTTMTLALGKPLASPHPWEIPGAWGMGQEQR